MIVLGIVPSRNPVQVMVYDMEEESLHKASMAGIILYAKKRLLINFTDSDERLFTQAGIPTISIQTFLSMCCGYAVKEEETNRIFKFTTRIHYTNVFCNRQVDFSALYSSPRFWAKIAKLVDEGMDMLKGQGMQKALRLEVRLTPVLHRMFDDGYPLDAERVKREYRELKNILSEVKRKIRNSSGDTAELLHLRKKTEDKIRRIPYEVTHTQESRAVIFCNFRSIGTDTFRITTNHINVQGLPKDIRKCFLPRHGDMLAEYDMVSSQIIILACLSGEESLIQSYTKGIDLYLHIVSALTGRHMEDITKEERNIYKGMILQMLYGAGITTMQGELKADGINLSYTEVKGMQKRFYQMFPAIREYSDRVKTADCIALPTGRIWNMKDFVEPYKRLAYIMQNTESVILREILVLIDEAAESRGMWLYLCIHDSVLVEMDSAVYPEMRAIVRKCFNKAMGKYLHRLKKANIKEDILYEGFKRNIRPVFNRGKEEQAEEGGYRTVSDYPQ